MVGPIAISPDPQKMGGSNLEGCARHAPSPRPGCVPEPRVEPLPSLSQPPGLRQACFSSMASPSEMPRWGPAWIMAFLVTEPATRPRQPWAPPAPEAPGPRGWGGSGGMDFGAVSILAEPGCAPGH